MRNTLLLLAGLLLRCAASAQPDTTAFFSFVQDTSIGTLFRPLYAFDHGYMCRDCGTAHTIAYDGSENYMSAWSYDTLGAAFEIRMYADANGLFHSDSICYYVKDSAVTDSAVVVSLFRVLVMTMMDRARERKQSEHYRDVHLQQMWAEDDSLYDALVDRYNRLVLLYLSRGASEPNASKATGKEQERYLQELRKKIQFWPSR